MEDPIVSKFKASIEPLRGKIETMYLFGSRARGTERPDSDYDLLLVVNNNFSIQDRSRLYDGVIDTLFDTQRLVSLKIFKERDFNRLQSLETPFMKTILREGIKIG